MILNFKEDKIRRSIIFEKMAKMLIRKKNKNNFIFHIREFDSFEELTKKYRLDLKLQKKELIEVLNKGFSSVD